jgi:hypothetical protein
VKRLYALVLASCSAPAVVRAPIPCADIRDGDPRQATYVGVTASTTHEPIANAKITAIRGAEHIDTTSDRDGHYRLAIPPGDYRIEVHDGDHVLVVVGWHAMVGTFGLDLVVDRSKSLAIEEGASYPRHSPASACAWTCPLATAPPPEWWTRAEPCPPGAKLQQDVSAMVVTVRCVKPIGVLHGARSTFSFDDKGNAHELAEWYQDGIACPTNRSR